MLKQVAVACVALAFATQAAAQSVIDRAKNREAQEQKQQQQQKAGAPQAGAAEAPRNPLKKKKYEDCNRKADAKKLSGDARKRNVDQCMKG